MMPFLLHSSPTTAAAGRMTRRSFREQPAPDNAVKKWSAYGRADPSSTFFKPRSPDARINFMYRGLANLLFPGRENVVGKLRQKC